MCCRNPFLVTGIVCAVLIAASEGTAQEPSGPPRVVVWSDTLVDASGAPRTTPALVTFSVYREEAGGGPLWVEQQTVTPDAKGTYRVTLGAATSQGLPPSIFAEGEARWLGVQVELAPEAPRVRLVSVPYALKAADADTLGGRPATAYMLTPEARAAAGEPTTKADADNTTNQVINDSLFVNHGAAIGLKLSGSSNHLVLHDTAEADTTNNHWYIWRTGGDGKLRFFRNGSDRVTFDGTGQVGIGTTSPAAQLHLAGASNHLVFQDSGEANLGNNYWYLYRTGADGKLRFFRNGSDRVTFDGNGQVGIGTTVPAAQLHLTGSNNHLVFQDSGEANLGNNYWYLYRTGADGKLRFFRNGSDRVTFDGTGRVGIGTTTPQASLQISASTSHVVLHDTSEADAAANWWYVYRTSGDGKLRFYRGADRITFDGTGNVGLGTTAPGSILDVAGAVTQRGIAAPAVSPAGQGRIYYDSATNKFRVSQNGAAYADLLTTGGLALPFNSGAVSNASTLFTLQQTGTGGVGSFQIANAASTATALQVTSNSTQPTARAAVFQLTAGSSSGNVVDIIHSGDSGGRALYVQRNTTGEGGAFEINNFSLGTGPALHAMMTAGSGDALVADNSDPAVRGSAASFNITTASTAGVVNVNHTGGGSGNGINVNVNSGRGLNVATTTGVPLFVNAATGTNLAIFQGGGLNRARIDNTGKGFFNGGTQASGADVAEQFDVDGPVDAYEPGDVLEISPNHDRHVRLSEEAYSTRVVGVYATKPGVLLSDLSIDADASRRVPLGVIGVIPTKVTAENGIIRRGDLLVASSTPGHAMKAGPAAPLGSVIGKALGGFSGPGSGKIEVLVNVR
jgi:hypothetical protein